MAGNASAIVLVSNLAETTNSVNTVGSVGGTNQFQYAVPFTTGANGAGYSLANVTLDLADANGTPSNFQVELFSSGGGDPNASLLVLAGNSNPATAGQYSYGGTFSLAPNTSYFVVASAGAVGGVNNYRWNNTSSTNESSPDGWTIGTGYFRNTGTGGSWTATDFPLKISVDASAIPEPGSAALLLLAAGGLAAARRRT